MKIAKILINVVRLDTMNRFGNIKESQNDNLPWRTLQISRHVARLHVSLPNNNNKKKNSTIIYELIFDIFQIT